MSKTGTTTKTSKIQDFMPHYKDMEEEFKAQKVKDLKTKKVSSWPYLKSIEQIVYEKWLSEVINEETGEWNPQVTAHLSRVLVQNTLLKS